MKDDILHIQSGPEKIAQSLITATLQPFAVDHIVFTKMLKMPVNAKFAPVS